MESHGLLLGKSLLNLLPRRRAQGEGMRTFGTWISFWYKAQLIKFPHLCLGDCPYRKISGGQFMGRSQKVASVFHSHHLKYLYKSFVSYMCSNLFFPR